VKFPPFPPFEHFFVKFPPFPPFEHFIVNLLSFCHFYVIFCHFAISLSFCRFIVILCPRRYIMVEKGGIRTIVL